MLLRNMLILLVVAAFGQGTATTHAVHEKQGGECPGAEDTFKEEDAQSCTYSQLASQPFHQNHGFPVRRSMLQVNKDLQNASLLGSFSKDEGNTTGDAMVWLAKAETMFVEYADAYLRMLKPLYEKRPYLITAVILTFQLAVLTLVFAFAGMYWTQGEDMKALLQFGGKAVENPEKYFKMTFGELTAMLGIPAFTIFHFSDIGLTGLQRRWSILALALQSWILQIAALGLILEGLRVYEKPPMSMWLIAIATYLNMLAHLGELPVAFLLLRYLHHFHSKLADQAFGFIICFVGGVLIPCASIVVGAFFLSTAKNLCDLMMKSVVFKFISNIDTWLTTLNSRTNAISGSVGPPPSVYLPNNRSFAKILNYILCLVPVVPWAVTVGLAATAVALRSRIGTVLE
mmetsp:Transcript_60846/g.111357  ORF Transcript_60846/g.111357 Transcript_60846/m.111357 type:complete len:401 (-) Transcript_60846:36-1238(-)